MKEYICEDCAYFYKINEKGGACRRYPPQTFTAGDCIAEFPWTYTFNWCGEFKKGKTLI